ncbi:MAG TPA: response regulator transcription factor [Ktedonobacterales bacterium]|jgi:DNA-binding NarL/FixJ family response regulator
MKQVFRPLTTPANTIPFITPRELQVLQWLACGLSNKEIAAALCLSDKTVATHMKSIFDKLGVHNRLMAVRVGQKLGLIDLNNEDPERERERERERASGRKRMIWAKYPI